jgi:hypothetical protein
MRSATMFVRDSSTSRDVINHERVVLLGKLSVGHCDEFSTRQRDTGVRDEFDR